MNACLVYRWENRSMHAPKVDFRSDAWSWSRKCHCNWCSGGMFLESFVTFLQKLEPAVHSDASTGPVKKKWDSRDSTRDWNQKVPWHFEIKKNFWKIPVGTGVISVMTFWFWVTDKLIVQTYVKFHGGSEFKSHFIKWPILIDKNGKNRHFAKTGIMLTSNSPNFWFEICYKSGHSSNFYVNPAWHIIW